MVKVSISEAAKRFDVSRPTLLKHLKSGRISGADGRTQQRGRVVGCGHPGLRRTHPLAALREPLCFFTRSAVLA